MALVMKEQDSSTGVLSLECGFASRPRPGEAVSGDDFLVKAHPRGVLLAMVDGLGHGNEATAASRTAIEILAAHPGEPVIALMERCHAGLKDTRGVAMTLISIDIPTGTLSALGVGNVETLLIRADPDARPWREEMLLRNGVVGYKLPALQASILPIHPGDLFIFTTDGIRSAYAERLNENDPVQAMAEGILEQDFRGNDDALVLTVRYLGESRG
jgi:negative regulator of sigma-B (phosphoserine phosphatase)